MISAHLHIGALLFEGIDQIDLTGPFEVLSRLPDVEYSIYAKTASPVRDINGLKLGEFNRSSQHLDLEVYVWDGQEDGQQLQQGGRPPPAAGTASRTAARSPDRCTRTAGTPTPHRS